MLAPAQKAFLTLLCRTVHLTSLVASNYLMALESPLLISDDSELKSLSLPMVIKPILFSILVVILL
jgi:hypothetical protein